LQAKAVRPGWQLGVVLMASSSDIMFTQTLTDSAEGLLLPLVLHAILVYMSPKRPLGF